MLKHLFLPADSEREEEIDAILGLEIRNESHFTRGADPPDSRRLAVDGNHGDILRFVGGQERHGILEEGFKMLFV